MEFTKIYRSFGDGKEAAREAAILDHQLPAIFLPPDPDDRVTGRFHYPPLVFTPQAAGDRGGFGYVFDVKRMRNLFDSITDERIRSQLEEVEAFWLEEDTTCKIRAAYPPEIADLLPSDNWTGEPGIAFPLYRMSGTHLDYGKLVEKGISGLEEEIRTAMEKTRNTRAAVGDKANTTSGKPENSHPDTNESPGVNDDSGLKNDSGLIDASGLNDSTTEPDGQSNDAHVLFQAMLSALSSLKKVLLFYERQVLQMLDRVRLHRQNLHLTQLAGILGRLQKSPPETFAEALQLSYLYCLCAGSNNFGRMDDYLGPFFMKDIRSGKLTRREATDLVKSAWRLINFREIIYDGRVIIGGRGRKHPEAADELALVIMDATQEVADVLPQLTLRMYEGMDPRLKEKAFDLIAGGNPYPMLYNDEVNVPSAVTAFGVDEATAENCIPFGCGEYVLYHKSVGTPSGVINLLKALEVTLHGGRDPVSGRQMGIAGTNGNIPDSFDCLWKAYTLNVEAYMHALALQEKFEYDMAGKTSPFLFLSMLFDDCIQRGKGIFSGGVRHLGGTIETYGNTNTADALLALKKLVYDTQTCTLDEIIVALDSNFEGQMRLRKQLLDQPKYGNDEDEADAMMVKVHAHVCMAAIREAKNVGLDSYLVVNINNDANTTLGKYTAASADGRLAYTSMANGNTPTMGMDTQGATALLNSLRKPRTDIHAGATQNFKLSREQLTRFRQQTIQLIDTYFKEGGAQIMITAVNKGDLEDAMEHPEQYPNLLVRVGGFSARFVELPREVQLEILNRTLY